MGKIIGAKMLKLNAIKSEKVWGYELWIASTHRNGLQKDFLEYCGGEYPLLVKIIQANDSLSVQVHPDDETAALLEGKGAVGKTECWYVLDAAADARLVYGLNGNQGHEPDREELSAAIKESRLDSYLNSVPVKKGDFVFIPAGTVHAIGGGLRLLEVQQSCDITYRLYDWGRPRELHIEKGLASVKGEGRRPILPFEGNFECRYFSLEEIRISGAYSAYNSGQNGAPDSVNLYFVIEGSGKVRGLLRGQNGSAENPAQIFNAEDIFAVAPGEKITFMADGARVMKIACRCR